MDNERNVDLGPPADFRDLWPRLKPFEECPTCWTCDGDGAPRETRVVGRYPGLVLIAWPYNNVSGKPVHEQWVTSATDPDRVYATRGEAALAGLAKVRDKLVKMAETLIAINDATAGAIKKAAAK